MLIEDTLWRKKAEESLASVEVWLLRGCCVSVVEDIP